MRDICKWHVEEFAYLVAKLKATSEGDGNMLERTTLVYVHEHAEANDHKNNGLSVIVAGGKSLRAGTHTRTTGTISDLYLAVANQGMKAGLKEFPMAKREIPDLYS